MKKIFLTALVFAASCSEWPRTELEREVTIKDNYTLIDTATVTTTTDLDHVTNNETINTVYITDTTEQDNTTNTQPILTQSVYELSLKGGTTGTVTSANWTADNLTALEFHVHGDVDSVAMNQTGILPANSNYVDSDNGFFSFNLNRSQMTYTCAIVNPDNVSDVQLFYQTKLYTYLKNNTNVIELEPVTYILTVD